MTTNSTSFLLRVGPPTRLCALLMLAFGPGGSSAQTINFAQIPLYVSTSVKPNLLAIYDNSESMDGTMAGKLIAGDDPSTRGNVARDVLRNTITTYRNTFQWGLGSFELVGAPALYTTYAYYFGSDLQVRYTNDCVAGISAARAFVATLSGADWERVGVHVTRGEIPVGGIMETMVAGHLEEHAAQLERLAPEG